MHGLKNVWEDTEELVSDGDDVWLKCKTRQSAGLVHVDYLSFSVRASSPNEAEVTSLAWQLAERLALLLGGSIEHGKGVHFYEQGLRIKSQETLLAGVWFGGTHQKGTVHCQLPGAAWLSSDSYLNEELYSITEEFQVSHLSRIDLARDCFDGESSYLQMQKAHEQGQFKPSRGVTPSIWNWEDKRRGSTCHVGRRENGKLVRGYEKSMQLCREQGWFRVELELRSVNRKIPCEAILNPAAYFAGANAYLASLADSARTERVQTFRKTVDLSVSHITDYCRIGYGKLVKLLVDSGIEADAIVERLTIGVVGLPRRLRLTNHTEILRVVGSAPPTENYASGAITA